MKFDESGNRTGTKPKGEDTLKVPFTVKPPVYTGPYTFEVGVDNVKGGWGVATPQRVCVDVKAIAYNLAKFGKWRNREFPLIPSILEAISDTSVNELIQREGEISPYHGSPFTSMDFDAVVSAMGHDIRDRMYTATKKTNRKVLHPIIAVEFPEEVKNTVTIGNMEIKVRK
jgi:hypothetical protein